MRGDREYLDRFGQKDTLPERRTEKPASKLGIVGHHHTRADDGRHHTLDRELWAY